MSNMMPTMRVLASMMGLTVGLRTAPIAKKLPGLRRVRMGSKLNMAKVTV